MKWIVLAVALFGQLTAQSQDFTLLASDPEGDWSTSSNFEADAKAFYYAIDATKDSIWFRMETYPLIQSGPWTFSIGIDHDFDFSNGTLWPAATPTSFKRNTRIDLFFDPTFLPPYAAVFSDTGLVTNSNSNIRFPDVHTVELGLKLSILDSDASMRLVAGMGDDVAEIHDDIPDAGHVFTAFPVGSLEEEEAGKQTIAFYPNPSKGNLTVESEHLPGEEGVLSIYNLMGQIQYQQAIQNKGQTLNLDLHLETGMYMLSWSSPGANQMLGTWIVQENP